MPNEEITLGQLYQLVVSIDNKVDELISSASIATISNLPPIDVEALSDAAHKLGWECGDSKCSDCNSKQQNACQEINEEKFKKLEKASKKLERKTLAEKGLPYTEKQLGEKSRKELVIIAGVCNINPFKLKDSSVQGLIKEILKQQGKVKGQDKKATVAKSAKKPKKTSEK